MRRRGLAPDPTCLFPGMKLSKVVEDNSILGTSWGTVRAATLEVYEALRSIEQMSERPNSQEEWSRLMPKNMSLLFEIWHNGEGEKGAGASCPAGMLSIALIMLIMHNRRTQKAFDVGAMVDEVSRQTLFHTIDELTVVVGGYNYPQALKAAERAGERMDVRMYLGRPWHEISFVDTLESQWPVFGLLDLVARLLTSAGRWYGMVEYSGWHQQTEIRVPHAPCSLREDGGLEMDVLTRRPRTASVDVLLDTDACALLGLAAVHFRKAKSLLGKRNEYRQISNWTAACFGPELLLQNTLEQCSARTEDECAALVGPRMVPKRCLKLRRSPGRLLLLRRQTLLPHAKAERWITEGERLIKEFTNRYGLYSLLWASASEPLVKKGAETIFGTLDAFQGRGT